MPPRTRIGILLPAAAGLALALLLAACATTPQPQVSGAWVRPSTGSDAPVAAYFVVNNGSGKDDALISVSSPAAASAEMHETSSDMGGMTGMKPVDRVDIKAGATLTFAPGGYHVMLSGLRAPLALGDKVELDLTFEHSGRIVVQAEVRQS